MSAPSADRGATIDVVVPCFNAGALVGEAVASILAQRGSFELGQVIVVDDRSTDVDTVAALRALAALPRVRVVPNDRAQGPGGARNCGAALARSRLLAFLDADDRWPADSLQSRMDALAAAPSGAFAGADFAAWDGAQGFEPPFFASRPRTAVLLSAAFEAAGPAVLTDAAPAFVDVVLCHCGVALLPKALFDRVGGFDETLTFCEDHLFFIELARLAPYAFTPTVALWYRQNPASLTNLAPFSPSEKYLRALRRLQQRGTLDQALAVRVEARIAELAVEAAGWHRQQRQFGAALRHAAGAVAARPFSARAWRQFAASALHRP